jgi:hypothetical protein
MITINPERNEPKAETEDNVYKGLGLRILMAIQRTYSSIFMTYISGEHFSYPILLLFKSNTTYSADDH